MPSSKHSEALIRIRQACNLGLEGRQLLPLVLRELRTVVPAAVAQFTWCTAEGRLQNFWSDSLMPRRIAWIVLHHRQYEADAGIRFADLVRFGQATGNLRHWWYEGFGDTVTARAVFLPYRLKWVLDGVVRDGERPYGCVLLMRHADAADFSRQDEALLAQVLPWLAHALRCRQARPRRFVAGGRSALLVCDHDGRVQAWSADAHRLVTYALVDSINLEAAVAGGDFEGVASALQQVVAALRAVLDAPEAGQPPLLVRRNGWGEFVFRAWALQSDVGAGGRIAVLVEQRVPEEAGLLAGVNALPLAPRQREIALLLAQGMAQGTIARSLGLRPLTVKDQVKDIYQRLDIHSREALCALLKGRDERPEAPAVPLLE